MIHGKRVIVVLPAYNAARTLEKTYTELPREVVDEVILVDDASRDETSRIAQRLGITTIVHAKNLGYGGNQKTCYRNALARGADVVIMVHPDYQYTPALVTAMASMVGTDSTTRCSDPGSSAGVRFAAGCRSTSTSPIESSPRSRISRRAASCPSTTRGTARSAGRCSRRSPGGELERFRLRQRDAGPDHRVRLLDRGGELPHPVLRGGLEHLVSPRRSLRSRRPERLAQALAPPRRTGARQAPARDGRA